MELSETRALLPEVHWRSEAESTNAVLRELVGNSAVPPGHGTVVVTANQTAGRGRQGRDWVTPADTSLAVSLFVRADVLASSGLGVSWLPLIAGSAVTAALQPLFRGGQAASEDDDSFSDADAFVAKRVGVKWPNDVHVRDENDAIAGRPGAKLSGILCEMLASGDVIVGFGVNLLQEDWQLPTERAGSVLACGGDTGAAQTLADERGMALADQVLARASRELLRLIELSATDPGAVRRRVLRDSLTVGAEVRVHLPNAEIVDGRAIGLDESGALIVDRPTTGQLIVSAADIEHLR